MATDLNLKWEWPANRQPTFTLVMAVAEVHEAGKGWLGIKKSPSLVEGMADPITLTGTIIRGDASLKNKTVSITLPKLEADAVGKGDAAAIAVLEDSVCICIKRLESQDEDVSNRTT